MKENENVYSLVCGILYENSFSIMDNWGKIYDEINRCDRFKGVFVKITDEPGYSRSVSNNQETQTFTISFNNLIYTHTVKGLSDQSFTEFKDIVANFFVPNVITKYNLITRRIGVVYSCKGSNEDITDQIKKYYKGDPKEISDIRFSKKETTTDALRELGKCDYINKIITIGGLAKGVQGFSYDYQKHFNPLQPLIDKQIGKVIDSSLKAFQEDIFGDLSQAKRIVG